VDGDPAGRRADDDPREIARLSMHAFHVPTSAEVATTVGRLVDRRDDVPPSESQHFVNADRRLCEDSFVAGKSAAG
jgi:hypothetical protein